MAEEYRKGVGAMIFNKEKRVFMAQRIIGAKSLLQMPQGGLENNETPEEGIIREVKEEIGTTKITLIRKSNKEYSYKFPKGLKNKAYNGQYVGQSQTWFLFFFYGDDKDINLCLQDPEFVAWQWVHVDDIVKSTIRFKKSLYSDLRQEFKNDIEHYK